MYRFLPMLIICFGLLTAVSYAHATGQCDGHGRAVCPNCHSCCTLKAECGKDDKSCWEVECEKICIPCVVFPWQKWRAKRAAQGACDACDNGCDSCTSGSEVCLSVNNGARVKTVKKLKKKTYECSECKYEWTPACCGRGDCCGDGYRDAGCDQGPLPVEVTQQQQEAYLIAPPTVDPLSASSQQQSGLGDRLKTVVRRSLTDE